MAERAAPSLDAAFAALLAPLLTGEKEAFLRLAEQVRRLAENVATLTEAFGGRPAGTGVAISPSGANEPPLEPVYHPATSADRLSPYREPIFHVNEAPSLASRSPAPLMRKEEKSAGADAEGWERTLLGENLMDRADLKSVREEFFDDVRLGAGPARSLLAQVMLTSDAAIEQLPRLLKEVGEAYYAWRPKSSGETAIWETALVDWLSGLIDEHGLRNGIELVHVGDRFDPAKHVSNDRGVEVSVVRGWVVLKENGKPLHRALVSVR